MTKIGDNEIGNVQLFYDAMEVATSYTVEKDALKIFYNKNNNYLLYKPTKK
jgi:hypothetical protein